MHQQRVDPLQPGLGPQVRGTEQEEVSDPFSHTKPVLQQSLVVPLLFKLELRVLRARGAESAFVRGRAVRASRSLEMTFSNSARALSAPARGVRHAQREERKHILSCTRQWPRRSPREPEVPLNDLLRRRTSLPPSPRAHCSIGHVYGLSPCTNLALILYLCPSG